MIAMTVNEDKMLDHAVFKRAKIFLFNAEL
jgi:hypothetical protein